MPYLVQYPNAPNFELRALETAHEYGARYVGKPADNISTSWNRIWGRVSRPQKDTYFLSVIHPQHKLGQETGLADNKRIATLLWKYNKAKDEAKLVHVDELNYAKGLKWSLIL